MRQRWFYLAGMVLVAGLTACKAKPKAVPLPPALQEAYHDLENGEVDKALAALEPMTQETPAPPGAAEAHYLKAYLLAYGKNQLRPARDAARNVVTLFGSHPSAPQAQKLVADAYYWQGNLRKAQEEYARLRELYGDRGYGAYALYQIGNCLYLQQKHGDALASYREASEKYPNDPLADSAQLRVAEVYLRVDNPSQAKSEFYKVVKTTRDNDLRNIAQAELESLEEERRLKRGASAKP